MELSIMPFGGPESAHPPRSMLGELRADHEALRPYLRRPGDALDALELRGDLSGVEAFASVVGRECQEHFPREEELVRALGSLEDATAWLTREHHELRQRTARLFLLLTDAKAKAHGDHHELFIATAQIAKTLSCHL